MNIEIWSDVFCPFCYIGKRNFETALAQVPWKDEVNVQWRSFQLMPHAQYVPGRDAHEALAQHLKVSYDEAKAMNARVSDMAAASGIRFDPDSMIWCNSFDAHRLIQYAGTLQKDAAMEEALFRSVFTDGKNISDPAVLAELAAEVGLPADTVQELLGSALFAEEVRQDVAIAQTIGLRGVPSFLAEKQILFSGALPVADFQRALEQIRTQLGNSNASEEGYTAGGACSTWGCDCH
ncbi:MAG: DsbA family oxidoreductase [Chitinophagaceae bacterium]